MAALEIVGLAITSLREPSDPSIEEILEAAKLAKWAGRGHIDGEHSYAPTSMERLQAHHDRMDQLMRVHTRLPEQIMLDAARSRADFRMKRGIVSRAFVRP
jgi:hypothetical protein